LFIVDIAVPRDVEPSVHDLPGVYLYDVDDLQEVVDAGLAERRRAADEARRMLDVEVVVFDRWRQSVDLAPTIAALCEHLHHVGHEEIERYARRLASLTPEQQAVVHDLTRSVIQKLLHTPIVSLKSAAERGEAGTRAALYREIFGLDQEEEGRRRRGLGADARDPGWKGRLSVSLRLGSRGSALALWQAHHVAAALRRAWDGIVVDVTIIETEGDQRTDMPLTASSGTGVFVKAIEDALLAGTIDLAVHSLKDLPTETPAGLVVAAIPQRHDPRDALVCKDARAIGDLKRSAVVATGSPRRQSQLLHARPDLTFTPVRGNVDTRLRKLEGGQFDALILAVAGLERLGLSHAPYTPIPVSLCLPAPGQGALAIETRIDDAETRRYVSPLDDAHAAASVAAERAFLSELRAGCLAPAGALATVAGDTLVLDAMIGTPDGRALKRDRIEGALGDARDAGPIAGAAAASWRGRRHPARGSSSGRIRGLVSVRVLITRPAFTWPALAARFDGTPIEIQMTATTAQVAPIDPKPGDLALGKLERYDWLVATSAKGVAALARRLAARRITLPAGVKVAALGPATARALAEMGARVDCIADEASSEGVADLLNHV
jgi:hydroxymethylbilane synthase